MAYYNDRHLHHSQTDFNQGCGNIKIVNLKQGGKKKKITCLDTKSTHPDDWAKMVFLMTKSIIRWMHFSFIHFSKLNSVLVQNRLPQLSNGHLRQLKLNFFLCPVVSHICLTGRALIFCTPANQSFRYHIYTLANQSL